MIPFVDLQAQYRSIKGEVDSAVERVLASGCFVMGREVAAFETEFAGYTGALHCVGVSSGTAAIQLALTACEIGAGDEVIVPANTFFATAEAVSNAGATPVFVDVDPVSYTIDPSKIEAAVTPRTRAVLPVHLYGQAADLDAIFEVASRHNLIVVEDAAQAHGSLYKGRHVGALGRAGCFSFYPGKNLGAYGEAGAVTTNDPQVARRVRLLRDHGSERKYHHETVGHNFRLEEIQGAVLAVKLRHLDRWNEWRRAHAARYHELLAGVEGLRLPRELDYAYHVYHLYVAQADQRDQLRQALSEEGIETGLHYPVPVHLQPAYATLGYRPGDLPEAERQARRVFSLPMFPELTEEQVVRVAQAVSFELSAASYQEKAGSHTV
ncbi:MAG: DegT/DnrJ/EryC1/StrS family aminotransferase [Pyrinomonadaceae bacterium]